MKLDAWIPPEVRSNVPRIVFCGKEEVLLEQHRGLVAYEDSRIRVQTACGVVSIGGRALRIAHFGHDGMRIVGTIEAVWYNQEVIK